MSRGFTLLELLIVLSLVALIGTGLAGTVSQTQRMLARVEARADLRADQAVVARLFRTQVARAVIPARVPGQPPRPLLTGDTETIRFFTETPVAALPPGRYEQVWRLVPTAAGRRLDVTFISSQLPEGRLTRTLADALPPAGFEYLQATEDGELVWRQHWDQPQMAPLLVRLRIADSVGWGEVIAPPRLLFLDASQAAAPAAGPS